MSFLLCLAIYTAVTFTLLKIPGFQKWKPQILAITGVLTFLLGRYMPELNSLKRGFAVDENVIGFFGTIFLVWLLIRFLTEERKYLFCFILAVILFSMGLVRIHEHEFFWGQAYISLRLIWLLWDMRDGRITVPPGLASYMAFVFYYPSLCVGPVFSYFDFEKQLSSRERLSWPGLDLLLRLLRGLLKFIVLAPTLHTVCITVIIFCGYKMTVWDYMLGLPASYVYLYLTFSGSTDIVLAVSQLLGFRLPENFDSPFKSKNVSEFWTRWNVSLGYFFRFIVYFPLQKKLMTLYPGWRNYFSPILLILIMFLMGLWHGFQWAYILYGLVHGVALVIHYFYSLFKPSINRSYPGLLQSRSYSLVSWTVTHVFVCLTIPLVLTPEGWLTW